MQHQVHSIKCKRNHRRCKYEKLQKTKLEHSTSQRHLLRCRKKKKLNTKLVNNFNTHLKYELIHPVRKKCILKHLKKVFLISTH